MEEQDKKVLQGKINYFHEKEIEIHIILNSGQFYNGTIIEESSDFFILNDFKLGDIPVFYIEIRNVIPYRSMK